MPPNPRPVSSSSHGNRDNPQDPDSTSSHISNLDAIAQNHERLVQLRNTLAQERAQDAASTARNPDRRPLSHSEAPLTSAARSRRRMRDAIRRFQEHDQEQINYASNVSDRAPSMDYMLRPRAHPSQRFQELNRQRLRRLAHQPTDQVAMEADQYHEDLHHVEQQLAQVNDDLRNLLDRPATPSLSRIERNLEQQYENENRRKRRRTEGPTSGKEYPKIEYGRAGQVYPGNLKMDLLMASEGQSNDPYDAPQTLRSLPPGAKNMLRDDKMPFNAWKPQCNIVLCHLGETSFDLDQLVIKVPKHAVEDNIYEGLVFTSNRKDATFENTAAEPIVHYSTNALGPRSQSAQSAHSHQQDNIGALVSAALDHASIPPEFRRPPNAAAQNEDEDPSSEGETINTTGPTHLRPHTISHSPSASSEEPEDLNLAPFESSMSDLTRNRASSRPFLPSISHLSSQIHGPPPSGDQEDDNADYYDAVAQLGLSDNLDQVLRGGNSVRADRRERRAHARQRAQDRRLQQARHSMSENADIASRYGNGHHFRAHQFSLPTPHIAHESEDLFSPQAEDNPVARTDLTGRALSPDTLHAREMARYSLEYPNVSTQDNDDPSPSSPLGPSTISTFHPSRTSNTPTLHPIARFTLHRPRPALQSLPPPTAGDNFSSFAAAAHRFSGAARARAADSGIGIGTNSDYSLPSFAHTDGAFRNRGPEAADEERAAGRGQRVSIRFDPPVSAKYILIKMWSRDARCSGKVDRAPESVLERNVRWYDDAGGWAHMRRGGVSGGGGGGGGGGDGSTDAEDEGGDAGFDSFGEGVSGGYISIERIKCIGLAGVRWFPAFEAR